MIEKLIIFENSGICLFSKVYSGNYTNNDDLATGFLAAMLGYMDTEFGKLRCIYTKDKILLICCIQGIYIVLIITQFPPVPQSSDDEEKLWVFNKRLENMCKAQLALLERKVGPKLLQLQLRREHQYNYKNLFAEMEQEIDDLISLSMNKINILERLFHRGDPRKSVSSSLRVYKS